MIRRRQVAAALTLALAILIVIAVVSYRSTNQLTATNNWVEHTHLVLETLEDLFSHTNAAESAARGYVITGDVSFLEPYRAAQPVIRQCLSRLQTLTADNPAQQQRSRALQSAVEQKLLWLADVVEQRREKGFESGAGQVRTGAGLHRMDEIRRLADEIEQEERKLLRERSAAAHAVARRTSLLWMCGNLASFALLLMVIVLLHRQVTRRQQAEEQSLRSASYARSLIEASLDPLVTIGKDGRIMDVNRATEHVTGASREHLIGRDFSDYFTEPEKARQGYQEVFSRGEVRDYPLAVRHASGSITDVLYNATVFRNQAEEVEGVFAAARDITERKRAEDELRKSENELAVRAHLKQLFLTVPDEEMYGEALAVILRAMESDQGVFGYIDESGALVVPSMTWGIWDKCQMAGKRIVFPRDTWGNSIWCRAIRERKALYSNSPSRVPEGHIPISRNISLPILLKGEAIGLLQVANRQQDYAPQDVAFLQTIADHIAPILKARLQRDQQEKKRGQAEEELRHLNEQLEHRVADRTAELAATIKELEAFTYSVSHDLRAPLRQINGFAKLLLEEFGPALDARAQQYLAWVQDGTRRMGQLVDDLLNLSRVGRRELRPQLTGMGSLVREVVAELADESRGRDVEWQIGDLPFVECDPALMRQVWANLLSNALKFTRPRKQARIAIGQAEHAGEPVIFVRDNGVGFSMKYVDKLFGVFQRLHREEDFEGTGVGLATVQRIIHKHGGRIWAEAELDQGAAFYFTLGSEEISNQAATPVQEVQLA